MKKKILIPLMLVTSSLLSGCSSGGLSASSEAVCAELAEIMKGSGPFEGTRETLMNAVVEIAFFEPPAVDGWITYVSPADGDYRPSPNDNDEDYMVYANLYRLQAQAIDYTDTKNSGAYYREWRYFEEGCGFVEE
jgi:hypothetical protein